jgi:hypothetical protein
VNPSIIKLNNNSEIKFEQFRKRIPIFKLSKIEIAQRRVTLLDNNSFKIDFIQGESSKEGKVNNFSINLDYRPNRNNESVNIKGQLANFLYDYSAFVNLNKLQNLISEFQEDNGLYVNANSVQITITDILNFIEDIKYKSSIDTTNIELVENIAIQVTTDFLKKLKNKVNWYINNSNYQYLEHLNQSTDEVKGDFIDKYYIFKTIESTKDSKGKTTFKTPDEIDEEVSTFEKEIVKIAESLEITSIGKSIYNPLLREVRNNVDGEKDLKITPDKLNAGEKKFVQDCANYFKDNSDFEKYEIYLMRNVETLKSIGIYLNDDSQVFYPDFILWMIKEDTIYINFIDPKGQMGLQDATTLLDNEKVKIADKENNDTLVILEKKLSATHNKTFVLNSFLLLRDSSVLGFNKPQDWVKENMTDKNIFRLNWHEKDEKGNIINLDTIPDGLNYLELMIKKTL